MKIIVFLDTNIIENDFTLSGAKFKDLLEAKKRYGFNLFLTSTNLYEILKHFKRQTKDFARNLNKAINQSKKFLDVVEYTEITRENQNYYNESFERKIKSIFEVYEPSTGAYKNSFNRFFDGKRPFRENKEEHRDSLIWETISEYAVNNPQQQIFFISDNYKDFAVSDKELVFHPDYDALNGRIIYKRTIVDFLEDQKFLKIRKEKIYNEIKEEINNYIIDTQIDDYSSDLNYFIADYFNNTIFEMDIFEGYGDETYLELKEIHELGEFTESEDYYYVPVGIIGKISYVINMRNPVYEKGMEDTYFLESDRIYEDYEINFTVIYNKKESKVEGIDEIVLSILTLTK